MELNNLELIINRNIWGLLFNYKYTSGVYNKDLTLVFKTKSDDFKLVYTLDSKTVVLYYYDGGKTESCLLTLDFGLSSMLKTIYQVENLKNLEKLGNILTNNLER